MPLFIVEIPSAVAWRQYDNERSAYINGDIGRMLKLSLARKAMPNQEF